MVKIEDRWKKNISEQKKLEHDLKLKAKTIAKKMHLRPIDAVIGDTPQQWYYFIKGASLNKKR